MAINFPDSPSAGDPHTEAGVTWTYDGEKWVSENTAAPAPAPALWTRAGTVLSPATAGDDVDLGSGDLSAAAGTFAGGKTLITDDTQLEFHEGNFGTHVDSNRVLFTRDIAHMSGAVPYGTLAGRVFDGAAYNDACAIKFERDDPASGFGTDGAIKFETNNANAGNSEKMRLSREGNLKIGGTLPASPNITLNANGSAAYRRAEGNAYINSSSTNLLQVTTPADAERVSLTVGGDVRHFGNVVPISDQSLKENIVDASPQWDDVKSIRLRNYTWIDAPEMGQMLGVIAQELEKVSPGLISEDEKGVKGFKLNPLVMKMLGALQEAQARIEALEAEVQALKGGSK